MGSFYTVTKTLYRYRMITIDEDINAKFTIVFICIDFEKSVGVS